MLSRWFLGLVGGVGSDVTRALVLGWSKDGVMRVRCLMKVSLSSVESGLLFPFELARDAIALAPFRG